MLRQKISGLEQLRALHRKGGFVTMDINGRVRVFCTLVIIVLSSSTQCFAQPAKEIQAGIGSMKNLLTDLKKTVVFIGDISEGKTTNEKKINLFGTGFLVKIQDIYYLITAKHIIKDQDSGALKDGEMCVFLNAKKGNINFRKISEIKKNFKVEWVFHKNPDVDIAIIPWPLDLVNDDAKVVPDELFTKSDRIFELYDIFFLSFQPGIEMTKKIAPVFKSGTVSVINEDGTFYINASVFPGNSGSPVFLKPLPVRFDENDLPVRRSVLDGTFIGIVGNYIAYQEVAVSVQTKRPRIVFEENTGLSKVWPVEYIQEILDSDVFKAQQMGLKKVFNIVDSKKAKRK